MAYFAKGGGGVSPISKGFYHKKLRILAYLCQKGGGVSHPFQKGFIIKKLRIFQSFPPKKREGEGVRISENSKKTHFLFYYSPLSVIFDIIEIPAF